MDALYLPIKLLHVASVVVFLGNITLGLFWKAHADGSRDPAVMANALAGIIRADRWFTIPGVVAIVASGLGLALIAPYPLLRTGWIFWSLVLFSVSGVVFSVWVAPLQRRLLALAEQARAGGALDAAAYRQLSVAWELSGAVALLTPVAAMALMVLKPL